MHPSPGRPEADCRTSHEQRSRKKDPGPEEPIEPAAKKQAEQCRDDDGPTEYADLAEPRTERRLGIGTTFGVALGGSLRRPCQAIELGAAQDTVSRWFVAVGAELARK